MTNRSRARRSIAYTRAVTRLYAKIPHLPGSRLGPSGLTVPAPLATRLLRRESSGDEIVVEEKLDGACVAVQREQGQLVARGRQGTLSAESPNLGQRAFAAWLVKHAHRFARISEGSRVMGEWLAVAHGTRYALAHEPFVVLDVFDGDVAHAHDRVNAFALEVALARPQVLSRGGAMSLEAAEAALGKHGHHGAIDAAEGAIYRLASRDRTLALAKYVRRGKRDSSYLADVTGGRDVANPYPTCTLPAGAFEIHVTVRYADAATRPVVLAVGEALGVRILEIELAHGEHASQPMTSSSVRGTFADAIAEARRVARAFADAGIEVRRLKLEYEARDPSVFGLPREHTELYFEDHVRVRAPSNEVFGALAAPLAALDAHLSRNSRRQSDASSAPERFVTLRSHGVDAAGATERVTRVTDYLSKIADVTVMRDTRELVVYDSARELDAGWA